VCLYGGEDSAQSSDEIQPVGDGSFFITILLLIIPELDPKRWRNVAL